MAAEWKTMDLLQDINGTVIKEGDRIVTTHPKGRGEWLKGTVVETRMAYGPSAQVVFDDCEEFSGKRFTWKTTRKRFMVISVEEKEMDPAPWATYYENQEEI